MLKQRFPQALALAALLALPLVAACGGDEDDPKLEESALVFEASFDSAVQVGQNTMMITLKDKDGKAVSGATVTVDPQMPHHGHGSTETPTVQDQGGGSYKAFPVTLQMPGMWVITIAAQQGETKGSHVMKVTVP